MTAHTHTHTRTERNKSLCNLLNRRKKSREREKMATEDKKRQDTPPISSCSVFFVAVCCASSTPTDTHTRTVAESANKDVELRRETVCRRGKWPVFTSSAPRSSSQVGRQQQGRLPSKLGERRSSFPSTAKILRTGMTVLSG